MAFAKAQGKCMNPRLNRWIIKLSEFNIIMNYIKGKDNQVADFLSRINADTNEINMLNVSDNNSLYNNHDDDIDTIHSQEESNSFGIGILDTVVNRFKTQIILTDDKQKDIDVRHKNKKIYISSSELETNLENILRRHITKGKVGIYTDLDDNKYIILQNKILELYERSGDVKFVRCSYHAKDVSSEDEAYKHIHNYHKNETGHTGINENYEGLKDKFIFQI